MGPALFVMAIMGCGDGSTMCAEARVVQTRFLSVEACQAAMPAALQSNSDLEYPELTGTCRRTMPIMASAKSEAAARSATKQGS